MGNECIQEMVKLGEYSGENILKLFNILTERFPDYEFIIGEGGVLLLYSLYSSSDDEIVFATVREYFKTNTIMCE
jgi:hypothetical protein